MGLLGALVGLPLLPVRGVVRLAELLEDEAQRQLTNPAAIRAQLVQLDEACAAGAITVDMSDEYVHERLLDVGVVVPTHGPDVAGRNGGDSE